MPWSVVALGDSGTRSSGPRLLEPGMGDSPKKGGGQGLQGRREEEKERGRACVRSPGIRLP